MKWMTPSLAACLCLLLAGSVAHAQPAPDTSAGLATPATPATESPAPEASAAVPMMPVDPSPNEPHEHICNNHVDDDHDGMVDCADADCFDDAVCAAGGGDERSNAACSDFVDNDGDGAIDCIDSDCDGPGITVCNGSLDQNSGASAGGDHEQGDDMGLPELSGDMTVEDLIGRYGDADGERNDYMCSDGIDNDGDGRTDCADFGCRFDPQVTVCAGHPGFHFSVVAGVGGTVNLQNIIDNVGQQGDRANVRFSRLQLRVLGPIPMIQDSFFLLSMRLEKSPRLTFAHFQVPIDNAGHFVAINSGSGTLSSGLIISTSKQPLLNAPFYLFNAFEQGNGAAIETGGPITSDGRFTFRLFAAGGSGEFNGNVGGAFFRSDDRNFSYSAGGQLGINLIGHYSRFDSPFLYTPGPLTVAALIGAKYSQRPRERYPAVNALGVFQYQRFLLRVESYTKYIMDYGGAIQSAWNAQTSILLIPRHLMFAADIGQFYSQGFTPDGGFDSLLRRPINQFEWRVALHWFWFRNIGVLSAVYRQTVFDDNPDRPQDPTLERELQVEAQFRF
ncbi:MAG: hypothetical protein GXP55_07275 [Deltaproteobacteria bacterium]|nr:hypothetical protein [Deltaproteobacteria bacterium]